MDGKAVDDRAGPFRLVVLADWEPARSARQLERLVVVDVTQRAAIK